MKPVLAVRFGVLYDQVGEPRRDGILTVVDGCVGEIGGPDLALPEGAQVVEAACVVPGLINAHVHLEQDAGPDTAGSFAVTTATARAIRAAEHARLMLRAGITTVRDLGASERVALEVRDATASGALSGPTVLAAGRAICMTGGHGAFVGREADGPERIRAAVRAERRDGADVIKFIATGGVLTRGAVPGSPELSEPELRAGVEEAHRLGLRAAAHAIGTEGIKAAVRAGVDSVEHGHLIDDDGIALAIEHGVFLVPTLAALRRITEAPPEAGVPDYVTRKAREVTEQAEHRLRRAYEAGIRIAAGSDAGTPFNRHADFGYELELMHTILGMSERDVLSAATVTAAELLGVRRGTLRPGDVADLLLLDRDIDQDIRVLARPARVVKAGLIVDSEPRMAVGPRTARRPGS